MIINLIVWSIQMKKESNKIISDNIVTLTISKGHLIKIIKNPKLANGFKYIGTYVKPIKKEVRQNGT